MTQPIVGIETIGPKQAEILLRGNVHNRHLRPTTVRRFAHDMKTGQWQMNGESIKVSDTGLLLDGQHRIAAIIESGCKETFVVVRGLPEIAQETVDIGEKRKVSDILALRGETSTNALAGALRLSTMIEERGEYGSNRDWTPTAQDQLDHLEKHPDIRDSVLVGGRVSGSVVRYPGSMGAGLHHVMALKDAEDADNFWDRLIDGVGLSEGQAILTLRQYLIRDLANLRRMDGVRRAAITIKAWNKYRTGEPFTTVKYTRGGAHPESFPKLT